MVSLPGADHEQIHFATPDEEWAIFDGMAHYYLKMSGEEFLRRWDAGEWQDDPDQPGVIMLALMLPLGRAQAA
jgi:hypothetical protein